MADQKVLKKRLKALMQQPSNQVCSDCPEKRPTWASLIVPPSDSPPGTEKIGSFCCLECSGSHRRLGVHISFVRSVNLDSWKEWEVRAMENGGNAKVNAIFEARLAQSGRKKPTNLADGPTRERYVRDKYERRKFYDPAGFSIDARSTASHDGQGKMPDDGNGGSKSRPGAPSDIARQRIASRQARMKTTTKSSTIAAQAPPARVAKAPVSAPVEFDLLDFGAETNASPAPTPSVAAVNDPFLPPATAPSTQTNLFFPNGVQNSGIPPSPRTAPPSTTSLSLAQELMNNSTPTTKASASNDDIMALFDPSKQQQNQQQSRFGMQAMNHMVPGGVAANNNNNNNNNKFMNVHLHVLMSLYQKDSTISILRHDNDDDDDCPAVEEKYWELIQYFLKQRCAIKTTTERVQGMSEICDQAVEFETNVSALPICENDFLDQQVSPQMNRSTANRKSSMKGSRSNNVSFRSSSSTHNMLITQPSPFLNRSSHARSWTNGTTSKSSVPSKNSGYIQESDNIEMAGGNAFGIVSGLLKYKRQLASKQLNQRYSTLHALVKESQNQIVNLNSRISNAIKETNEDTKVEIETKIGLWKLLLRDLTEILS